jgi:hypothetical protein
MSEHDRGGWMDPDPLDLTDEAMDEEHRQHALGAHVWETIKRDALVRGLGALMIVAIVGLSTLHFMGDEVFNELHTFGPPGTSLSTSSFQLEPRAWRPLCELRLSTAVDDNHELGFEVTLVREGPDEPLFSYVGYNWQASGTWHEGFESGTWLEHDQVHRFRFRVPEGDRFHLDLVPLSYESTKGVEAPTQGQRVRVRVLRGVVSPAFPWLALAIAGLGFLIAIFVAAHRGNERFVMDEEPI